MPVRISRKTGLVLAVSIQLRLWTGSAFERDRFD